MALFLIMAENHAHLDPVVDARGSYKRGDIVEVFDDAAHNGDLVANPIMAPFVMVRVSGVTKAQVERLMQPRTTTAIVDGREVVTVITRRRHQLQVDTIPSAIRNELIANRFVEVSWSQVRNYLLNKETGGTEGATP